MKQFGEYFFTKVGYLYTWRFIELTTIIIAAHFLDINEFSIGFFAVVLAYFLMSLFDVSMDEKESSEIRKFCNTLSLVSPLYGVLAAGFIVIISFIYPLELPLRLASVIALFISFKKTAELFYKSRGRHEKIFKINMLSQIISSIILLALLFLNFGGISIIISYIFYNFMTTVFLWSFFPFKIKSKFHKESYLKIMSSIKSNFGFKITKKIITYTPLIIVGFFNREYFSYIYLAFVVGYFLYRNLTLFITGLFSEKFQKMSRSVFKYNLVKITEYLSFIIFPLSFLSIVLIPQISSIIVNWPGFPEILLLMLSAGLIKSISDISRLVFLVEPKETILVRLSLIEILILFVSMVFFGLVFGSYGVAIAILSSVILSSSINLLVAQRLIKLDLLSVSKNFFYIFFSALLSALSVGFLKEWYNIRSIYSLIFIYFVGILIYLFLTFLSNKVFYKAFVRFVFEVLEE